MDLEQASDLAYINLSNVHTPFDLFEEWSKEVKNKIPTPFNFNLATATKTGTVTNRTVLLQDFIDKTFVCVICKGSRKFEALNENPNVAMTFVWSYNDDENGGAQRQIRVEGVLEELSEEISTKYFDNFPLFAKIRSVICDQGKPVVWEELKQKHDEVLKEVKEKNLIIKKPEHVVACKITPKRFDFYFAKDNLIADRVLFELSENGKGWLQQRIAT